MTSIEPDPSESAYLSVVTYRDAAEGQGFGQGDRHLRIEVRVKPDRLIEVDSLRLTSPSGDSLGEKRVSPGQQWYRWDGEFPAGTYRLDVVVDGDVVEHYEMVFDRKAIV